MRVTMCAAAALLASGLVAAQPCGFEAVTTWLPARWFTAMANGGGRYVVVGGNGLIAASDAAASWRLADRVTASHLRAVTYAAGRFVAVGEGVVVTSPDGVSWTVAWSDAGSVLVDVAWIAGRFVAIGELPEQELTSSDGASWSLVPTGVGEAFGRVESKGDLLVAIGSTSGRVYASADGLQWELRNEGFGPDTGSLSFDGTQLMLVTDEDCSVRTSVDGWTWTLRFEVPPGPYGQHCWGHSGGGHDGLLVATWGVLHGWNYELEMWVSTDGGEAWQQVDLLNIGISTPCTSMASLLWDGSRLLALEELGDVLASTDALTWECTTGFCTSSGPGAGFWTLEVTPQALVALGEVELCQSLPKSVEGGPVVAMSADGVGWSAEGSMPELVSLTWGNGRYVAAGRWRSTYTSPDGWTWLENDFPALHLSRIAFGAGVFVVVGDGGFVASSGDGESWTPHSSGTSEDFTDLLWDGQRFLAAASGVVSESPDGVSWTTHPTGLGSSLTELVTTGDGYLALGTGPSRIVRSVDGALWTDLYAPSGLELKGLEHHDGLTVAVGFAQYPLHENLIASADGTHWTRSAVFPGSYFRPIDVAWYGGAFVVVGQDRAIFRGTCVGTLLALDPPWQQLPVGRTGQLTLTLSPPVSASATVALSVTPAAVLEVPAAVSLAPGQASARIPCRGLSEGLATVVATLPAELGGGWTSATVEVTAAQLQGNQIPVLSAWGATALALLIAALGVAVLARFGHCVT